MNFSFKTFLISALLTIFCFSANTYAAVIFHETFDQLTEVNTLGNALTNGLTDEIGYEIEAGGDAMKCSENGTMELTGGRFSTRNMDLSGENVILQVRYKLKSGTKRFQIDIDKVGTQGIGSILNEYGSNSPTEFSTKSFAITNGTSDSFIFFRTEGDHTVILDEIKITKGFDEGGDVRTPAFPGAGGGGKYTSGGRGGRVLYVTKLTDDNSQGTLRWAVNQTGPRTILFKVSGTIALNSALNINNGDVTIAGQSAPGDGICLRDHDMQIKADNVIIRFVRFRLGNKDLNNESDAIWGRYRSNIILDHCSMSWSIDECASFYANNNFTMQWCFVTESLNNAGHSKGAHGYGGLWGGKNTSFHHNLLAHHNSRNPRFNGWKRSGLSYNNPMDEERVDFRNNVIYNWGDNSSYGGESLGKYNIVGNYFKYGPGTKSSIRSKITQIDKDANPTYAPGYGSYYITDNYVYGNATVTANNWASGGVTYASGVTQAGARVDVPFEYVPIIEHTAETAFEKVLQYGGASLSRDIVDDRVAEEALQGTATYSGSVTKRAGIIDTPEDVGGYPVYSSTAAPTDSDNDGIPDGWLEANYPGKTANDTNAEGYTYLEVYLNSLVQHIVDLQDANPIYSSVNKPESNRHFVVSHISGSSSIHLRAEHKITNLYMYDISGRRVFHANLNAHAAAMDLLLSHQSVYVLRVQLEDGSLYTQKLIW